MPLPIPLLFGQKPLTLSLYHSVRGFMTQNGVGNAMKIKDSGVTGIATSERCATVVLAIEGVVLQLLQDVARTANRTSNRYGASTNIELPTVRFSDPRHSIIVEDGGFATNSVQGCSLVVSTKHFRRLGRLFGALDCIHRLSSAGRTATQRELFYRVVADGTGLWRNQRQMDAAIRDATGLLRIGRPHLGILTTERGLIAGSLSLKDISTGCAAGATAMAPGSGGAPISEAMLNVDDSSLDVGAAHCVLVVEKDTLFQHLLQGRLLVTLPLILVTGRGYPDVLTRRLLQRLRRLAPQLPQVYLGDYDPHGVHIFLTYKVSCPFLHWLGMHEIDTKGIPKQAALPLSLHDKSLRASLLRHPTILDVAAYKEQVQTMDQKFELEALHAAQGSEAFAQHFVPEKIMRCGWI